MMTFTVAGVPVPQGSKRYIGRPGGRGVVIESSTRVRPWRADVRAAAEAAALPFAEPIEGPVSVRLAFRFPRPKAHRGARGLRPSAPVVPATRPDLDKLTRAVLDALAGIAWHDDAQVVELVAHKLYADDCGPGVEVTVTPTTLKGIAA